MKALFEKETFNQVIYEYFYQQDLSRGAIIFNDTKILGSEMKAKTEIFIKNLSEMGVTKGTVVGYTVPNCPEAFYLLLALASLGACSVPIFHMIPDMGKLAQFAGTKASHIITTNAQLESLQTSAQKMGASFKFGTVDPSDKADYVFNYDIEGKSLDDVVMLNAPKEHPLMMATSSGTTGIPKIVLMNQGNGATIMKTAYELTTPVDPKDELSCIMAFPMSTSGILVCLGMLIAGFTLIFSDDMSPVTYLKLIQQWKADTMAAPPAYFETILTLPMLQTFDVESIKRVYTGMDFFPNKLLKRLTVSFPNITMAGNGYGLIETTTVVMIWKALSPAEMENPTNTMYSVDGSGNEIDVLDPETMNALPAGQTGEVFIKGNSVVNGYLNNPEESKKTFKDGWFRTGDVAKKEENGHITLLGRNKYLIKRGGRSVSPVVVRDEINKMDSVVDSAVVGVPHPQYGEMTWAFVVKKPDTDISTGDVMRFCRENLTPYMVPDNISFLEALPKNPGVGKLNYESMKKMALEQLGNLEGENNG